MEINTNEFGILTPSVAALSERREKRRSRVGGTAATADIVISFHAVELVDVPDQTGIGMRACRDYNNLYMLM